MRRPMTLGEILRGALTLYCRNLRTFIAISSIVVPLRVASIAVHRVFVWRLPLTFR